MRAPRQTDATPGVRTYGINKDFALFSKVGLGGLVLTDETAKEYRQCVDSIHTQVAGKTEHISRSAVESSIQRAMLRAIDSVQASTEKDFSKRLTSALSDLSDELGTKPSTWEVHYPIEGVLPDKLPFTFGKCEFYFGDDACLDLLLGRVDRIIVSLVGEDAVQDARRDAETTIRQLVKGKTGVSATVDAVDAEAARLLARKMSRQIVDILNFYANLGNHPPSEVLLFSEGRGPGALYTFLFAEEPPAFQSPMDRFGPAMRFSFAASHLDGTGFQRMSDMLKKPENARSKIEDRLVAAFQWAGKASVEPRKEEAFLLFAISLESLLLERNDKSEISETLALRAAHLISGPQSRRMVYEDMKRLYRVRSNIVHSGSVDVAEDQLSEIRYYARLALLTVLCSSHFSEMTKDEELMKWFQERLLSANSDPPS